MQAPPWGYQNSRNPFVGHSGVSTRACTRACTRAWSIGGVDWGGRLGGPRACTRAGARLDRLRSPFLGAGTDAQASRLLVLRGAAFSFLLVKKCEGRRAGRRELEHHTAHLNSPHTSTPLYRHTETHYFNPPSPRPTPTFSADTTHLPANFQPGGSTFPPLLSTGLDQGLAATSPPPTTCHHSTHLATSKQAASQPPFRLK